MNASSFFGRCCPNGITPLPGSRGVTSTTTVPLPTTQKHQIGAFRIGYHLRGSFDDLTQYSITLFPDERPPNTWIQEGNKKVEFEVRLLSFPPAWKLLNVAKFFFERNLIVTKQGSVWFGNRHVEVRCGENSVAYPVTVDVHIEGIANGCNYRLDMNTADPNDNNAAIQDKPEGEYIPVKPNIGSLSNLTRIDFQKHLPRLDGNLKIEIFPQPLGMRASFDLVIPDPNGKKDPDPSPEGTILNAYNARSLLRAGSPEADKIVEGMVNSFTKDPFPSEDALREIGELIELTTPHNGFRIINSLITHLLNAALKDLPTLRQLTTILSRYQQTLYQNVWKDARNCIDIMQPLEYLGGFDPTALVDMLKALTTQLGGTHSQSGQVAVLTEQLKATIALLDIMTIRSVQKVDSDVHIKAYKALAPYQKHPDLRIAYLANYGTQSFTLIPKSRSTKEAFLHRGFLFLRGVAQLQIDPTNPLGIISSLISAYPDIKEAFEVQDPKKEWFIQLQVIRRIIFGQNPEYFFPFEERLRKKFAEVQNEIDTHNINFVVGFADLLWEVLHAPQLGTMENDIKIKKMAIEFYKQIHDNHKDSAKSKETHPFMVGNYKPELRKLISERLQQLTTSKNPRMEPVRDAAQTVLRSWGETVPTGIEPFDPQEPPTQLFDKAVKENYPLLLTLQSIHRCLLSDPQFVSARSYFTPLDAKGCDSSAIKPLDTHLQDFLKSDKRVLAIGGAGGAGKSLGIKMFAHQLLENYTEKEFFPVYVSLPRLKDYKKGAVSETLKAHGIGDSDLEKNEALKKKNTVWIFDAYDELSLPVDKDKDPNIYNPNGLADLGPNAKIIFLYRTGASVNPTSVFEPDEGGLQELIIEPFSEERIFDYLDRFWEVRTKYPPKDLTERMLMTKNDFLNSFTHLQAMKIWEVLANPFRLRICAECVSIIEEANKKEHPSFKFGDLFQTKEPDVIAHELFSYFACIRALRAQRKLNSTNPIQAVKFLEHQAKVASRMGQHRDTMDPQGMIPQDMEKDSEAYTHFAELFLGIDPDGEPNRIFAKEFEEITDKDRKYWTFMHDDYREYFAGINSSRPKRSDKQRLIDETISEKKFKALFPQD